MSPTYPPLTLNLLPFAVSAAELPRVDLDLAPRVNGDLPSSGDFPAHAMAEQIGAFVTWTAETGRFDDLPQVAGDRLAEAYRKR